MSKKKSTEKTKTEAPKTEKERTAGLKKPNPGVVLVTKAAGVVKNPTKALTDK